MNKLIKKKILYIDDCPIERQTTKLLFEIENCDIDCCQNLFTAMEHYKKKPYDIIIIDWNLSECTGLDVAKKLNSYGNNIPIILISGLFTDDMIAQANEAGFTTLMEKGTSSGFIKKSLELDA